jgi:hypothetical protein
MANCKFRNAICPQLSAQIILKFAVFNLQFAISGEWRLVAASDGWQTQVWKALPIE